MTGFLLQSTNFYYNNIYYLSNYKFRIPLAGISAIGCAHPHNPDGRVYNMRLITHLSRPAVYLQGKAQH